MPTATSSAGIARAGAVELAWESFGDPADPPLLLVMGLGAQMISWPDELCADLAAAGHHVIRFDNRDIGASTHLDDLPLPRLPDLALRRRPPYCIEDMADDVAGLLDALGLDRVHVAGASMGGFISQAFAIRHPERVRSLTLIMTSTGARRVGRAKLAVLAQLARNRTVAGRDAFVEGALATSRVIGSPGFPRDEERVRALAERAYERDRDTDGRLRQFWAVACQKDRTKQLPAIAVPTLVIHGLADPLVGANGGMAVARAIPGARFVGYAGMGHDLPRPLWSEVVREITALTGAGAGADDVVVSTSRDA